MGDQFCKDENNGFLDAKRKWPTVIKTERLNELIDMGYNNAYFIINKSLIYLPNSIVSCNSLLPGFFGGYIKAL